MNLNLEWITRAAAVLLLVSVSACATDKARNADSVDEPRWQANGYLAPGRTDTPEIIGQFESKKGCEAAADAWMQRQVVGNPIFAECLPIDTR